MTPVVKPEAFRGHARTAISILEQSSGWIISYSNRMCLESEVILKNENRTLLQHLEDIFAHCSFSYVIRDNKIILRPVDPSEYSYTVSGFTYDISSGETLPGANIFNYISGIGTAGNNYGFYSITLPGGSNVLTASFVGYSSETKSFELRSDTVINFNLQGSFQLAQVNIESDYIHEGLYTTNMGTTIIPIEEIKQTPALLGETDLVKNIQMLPGIQGGSEGFSGLYVRGGGPDQNLILLDDVPRSEEHTSELQSRPHLVCRLLLEKKKQTSSTICSAAGPG